MFSIADTSVLIDVLRGDPRAIEVWRAARTAGRIGASEITRVEVLAGMRPGGEQATLGLLDTVVWVAVDAAVAVRAGEFGRRWLPSHRGIDAADLVIAATADLVGARLLTRNVRRFPMFEGLTAPY